jgi:hypothetical protein
MACSQVEHLLDADVELILVRQAPRCDLLDVDRDVRDGLPAGIVA